MENINFNINKIYDKNDYSEFGSKKSIIKSIMDRDEQAIFIDDSSKHIQDCSSVENLQCLQPEWGYVSNNDNTVSKQFILKQIKKLIEEYNV